MQFKEIWQNRLELIRYFLPEAVQLKIESKDFKNSVVSSTVKLVPIDFGTTRPFLYYLKYDITNMMTSIMTSFICLSPFGTIS